MNAFEYPIDGPNAYAAIPCVPVDNTTERLVTAEGIEYVQTPDSAFEGLADVGFPWDPNYAIVDGMRMHYVDVGGSSSNSNSKSEIVLLLHGQPSWSFLYRKMIPVFVERGYRVIAPDWIGMGRSDKPTSLSEHTYLKQVGRLKSFVTQVIPEALDKPTINAFVQDWGSLIGLRTVGDEPQWFKRVVVANGMLPVLPTGINPFVVQSPVNYNCSDTRNASQMFLDRVSASPCGLDQSCFSIWINYALTSPALTPSDLAQLVTSTTLRDDELAPYDAPFPTYISRSAIRAFPSMIAAILEPDFGNIEAWSVLRNFSRPFLALAGEDDPILGSVEIQRNLYESIVGAQTHLFEHRRYENASHFIQEDVGVEMATYVADFIDGTTVEDDVDVSPPSSMPSLTSSAYDSSLHLPLLPTIVLFLLLLVMKL